MRDDLVLEIERLTGRKVTAFLSDNHIDPDVAIECFQPEAQGTAGGQATDGGRRRSSAPWVPSIRRVTHARSLAGDARRKHYRTARRVADVSS
jgi:hypothetical protein